MKFNAGAASRLRTLHPGRKAHLRQTEHPNALPALWHCPGQPKGVVGSSSLSTPGSLSVMDATDQLCRKDQYGSPLSPASRIELSGPDWWLWAFWIILTTQFW